MEGVRNYEGVDTYKQIEPLLNDGGRSLMIITPFISPYYSKMLLRIAKRKEVRIITSASEINRKALKELSSRNAGRYIKAVLYLLALTLLLIYFNLTSFAIGTAIALAVMFFLLVRVMMKRSPVKVKVAGNLFIHEKAYISWNRAIVGSANLTFSGTHKNLEHIEVIDDANEISRLSSHFERLWAGQFAVAK